MRPDPPDRIGVVRVRRLVAVSVALTGLLAGGCGPPASRTPTVLPANSSPAAQAISSPTTDVGTLSGPNPCQLLTLADVRQAYPAASLGLGPVDFPGIVTVCTYTTGLPEGSQGPPAVSVSVRPDDDAAWARDLNEVTVNFGFTPVPGLADAIISPSASSGSVHRGTWRVQIGFVSPSGDPAVLTLFLGIVAIRL